MNISNFPHPDSIHEQNTKTITYLIAALIISNKNFPAKGLLPRPYAPPLNSLGHYLLLDYKLLLKIIWQVVDEIKSSAKEIYSGVTQKSLFIGIGVAIGAFILLGIMGSDAISAGIIGLIAGGITYFVNRGNARFKILIKKVAEIRAKAITQLIAGNWESNLKKDTEEEIDELLKSKEIGDGALGNPKIPVLVITKNEHPFPGYGRLQAENLFLCRPKEKTDLSEPFDQTLEKIQDNIFDAVSKFPLKEVAHGHVVAIHGNTIPIDSPWLNEDKSPLLWTDRQNLENLSSLDVRVSLRRYFAVQALFPEYGTIATFFIRPFMAGNSISCHISVTTIGPLAIEADYFQKKLLKHQQEEKDREQKPKTNTKAKPTSTTPSRSMQQIQYIKLAGQVGGDFQSSSINYEEIKKLNLKEKHDDETYTKEFREMVEKATTWPGSLIPTENWREDNSLTFTNDFFGRTEALASVRTLYDQISRAVVDTFDALGFDISEYRDAEGKYTINAEKIENLVMGERIQMTQTSKNNKSSQGNETEKKTQEI